MYVHIRWMIRLDYPEVLKIERDAFVFGYWLEEDFLRALRQRNCIGMVAEPRATYGRGPVLGYMLYELRESALRILKFAVDPELQGKGVGKAMIQKLIGKLSSDRRPFITIELRERNLPGLLFFQSQGFRAVHCVRGTFEDTGEDGVVMRYSFEGAGAAEMEAVSVAAAE
jgi:[ribosomal protein S18]-alanine N-acetyltransferase